MSSNRWTQEQLAAITTKGCDILVAAGAGSGKTAVLVERIIRKVIDSENPIDIDKLLVVTFTNAAASEMRERMGNAITLELDKNPDSEILQKQLTLLPKASITTIHSFCLDVIRNNFHIIDIDPNFRIADETETTLLKQETIEELFDQMYEKGDKGFYELVEAYGGRRDDVGLIELVLELYRFAESSPWPSRWLLEAAENFNVNQDFSFDKTKWAAYMLKNIDIEMNGLAANMIKAMTIIERNEQLEAYTESFAQETSDIQMVLDQGISDWGSFVKNVTNISFNKLKPVKGVDAELKKSVTVIRDKVKKRVKDIQSNLEKISPEHIIEEMQGLYPMMSALARLTVDFKEAYTKRKQEKNIIDFGDIEHYALEILTEVDSDGVVIPSDTAKQYKEKYEEVLVDEYQDSNMVQEVMLMMVSRRDNDRRNLFMVGDVKQSIYRFRQAMPELFLSKYHRFSLCEGTEQKILLFKNFRSRKGIIDGVNFIFKQIMSENIGELDYDDNEKLNLGASFPDLEEEGIIAGAVELHIIDNKAKENTEALSDSQQRDQGITYSDNDDEEDEEDENGLKGSDEDEDISNIELEALLVARRIKELTYGQAEKEYKILDARLGAYRKVEYKDIVILLRATKNWSEVFMETFHREGIPAFADTGTGYFDTIEIKTIMALLQVIDNPIQDIPLLAVLRSPIFGFTPNELIDIHLDYKEVSFYEALRKCTEDSINERSIKVKDFLDKLQKWQEQSIHAPVDEFIWFLYMETGYLSYAGAMPGGVQRQANLKVLFERAKQFEATSYKGLFNFINFVNKLKRGSGDMGSAKILGENENVVRIMSIHKSKGLEFPVVFVCGAGKGFNMMDLTRNILFHKELGFGPDYIDTKRRFSYSSTIKEAIKTVARLETLSEEMRVLYVAFTRAREKLIITGSVRNLEKNAAKWVHASEVINNKLSEFEILTSKNYLDWICPCVINHSDGEQLFKLGGGIAKSTLNDESEWEVKLWDRQHLQKVEESPLEDENESLEKLINQTEQCDYLLKLVEERLSYIYPYKNAIGIPAKISVSELKRAKMLEFIDEDTVNLYSDKTLRKPLFSQEKEGFTAAEKGTLMHYAMQQLRLDKVDTIEQIKQQLSDMVQSEMLREDEVGVINASKLKKFFESSLGARMRNSSSVMREVPFSIEIPANNIYKGLAEDDYINENIVLQGVIDCCFVENGEFILLDYKTDFVEEGHTEMIKERYKLQLECYVYALEKITGNKVNKKYLYLFYNNQVVEC